MRIVTGLCFLTMLGLTASCSTSREEQRNALAHQQSSDVAASRGEYGVAGAEQRKAEDSHHKAVNKAIDEGIPVPPQTAPGDRAYPSDQPVPDGQPMPGQPMPRNP